MTQLDTFETALLAELREHAAAGRTPNPRRPPFRIIAGAGLVAAAAVAAVVLPGPGTSAAYSVVEGNAGEVRVSVDRLEDAAGLESALAEHGIAAEVTYVPDGGECAPGRYAVVDRDLTGLSLTVGSDRFEVSLPPGAVRDGETFVIAASLVPIPAIGDPDGDGIATLEGSRVWVQADVAAGPVAECTVVPES